MLNISRYPFPRKSWGGGGRDGSTPPPLNLERWHQASHSLIEIRPGGPLLEDLLPRCVGSVWDVPLGGWGGRGKRVSNTTRRVDQDDPESGKGLRNGSVRSSTGLVCACVFARVAVLRRCMEIWIGPQSVRAEVPLGRT